MSYFRKKQASLLNVGAGALLGAGVGALGGKLLTKNENHTQRNMARGVLGGAVLGAGVGAFFKPMQASLKVEVNKAPAVESTSVVKGKTKKELDDEFEKRFMEARGLTELYRKAMSKSRFQIAQEYIAKNVDNGTTSVSTPKTKAYSSTKPKSKKNQQEIQNAISDSVATTERNKHTKTKMTKKQRNAYNRSKKGSVWGSLDETAESLRQIKSKNLQPKGFFSKIPILNKVENKLYNVADSYLPKKDQRLESLNKAKNLNIEAKALIDSYDKKQKFRSKIDDFIDFTENHFQPEHKKIIETVEGQRKGSDRIEDYKAIKSYTNKIKISKEDLATNEILKEHYPETDYIREMVDRTVEDADLSWYKGKQRNTLDFTFDANTNKFSNPADIIRSEVGKSKGLQRGEMDNMSDVIKKVNINDFNKPERYIAATGTGLIGATVIGGTGYLAKKGYEKFRGEKK